MLLSPKSGPQKRKELGCDENLFDSLPITETCKNMFKNPGPHPWIKQGQAQRNSCSMQLIDYMENTNVNVNIKKTICQTSSLDHICTSGVLAKMCLGKWNFDNTLQECKGAGVM